MSIAKFTSLIHTVYAQIKEIEDLARAAQSEANTLEKRKAALEIDIRNGEENLKRLEEQRAHIEDELKKKAAKLAKK